MRALATLVTILEALAVALPPSPATAATTITWWGQSSYSEMFEVAGDFAGDVPQSYRQDWTRYLVLSDRTLQWPATVTVASQLDPYTLRTSPATVPQMSGGTATYIWNTATNRAISLGRTGLTKSPGFAMLRDLGGRRTIAALATESRHVTVQFLATRPMPNYSLYVYFEPNWGIPTPPTLPVAPSDIRCMPAQTGSDPLRPVWHGGALPAGAVVSVACDVTLTNRTTSAALYAPEVYLSQSLPGGTAMLTSATSAVHDDPILGHTTYAFTPPDGTPLQGYATSFSFSSGMLDWQNEVQTTAMPPSCAPQRTDVATRTVYLPNITKTLGGPNGWVTPFVVQNTAATAVALELSFYRFSDGSCVARRFVTNLAPGTSYADVPNNDSDLPGNTQFSVVVRSFGGDAVAVVNQVQGSGATAQGLAYSGSSEGGTRVSLPNVTRRFYGWDVPFIVQNVSSTGTMTLATATFRAFDGSHTYTKQVVIPAGRSAVIDPDYEPAFMGAPGSGLRDGTQYGVTITSAEAIAVVANAHTEQAAPAAYSHNGLTAGAPTVWAPFATKDGTNGTFSPIVVQNTGSAAASVALEFTPLGGGSAQRFTLSNVAPGASRAFDVRFTNGDPAQGMCATAADTCLGPGSYSVKITSAAAIAAVVLPVSATTAAAYAGSTGATARVYLPNVTRTLGGSTGWTTSIYVQSTTATGITIRWYRFSDGSLVSTSTLGLAPGTATKIDPRYVDGLADNTQYAAVVDGIGGDVVAIVHEQASGGDSDMIYEGFGR